MQDILGKELEPLTDSEELVLKVIYSTDDNLALNDVRDACNNKYGKAWAPQTVSTFLARIVRKGYLESYRQGRIFFYKPLISREDFLKQKTGDFVDFWFKDNAGEMLESLVSTRALRDTEISKIKELISTK